MPFFSASQQFTNLAWGLAIAWLWKGITSILGMPSIPDLSRIDPAALPPIPEIDSPDLTVVVPARDEQAVINQCLRSLVDSVGVKLQIIAVDDRSADRTGELMDAIAAEARAAKTPHWFEVIHITELPAGWLGKPHALAEGAKRATAPWILFTDGDVLFGPRALELALRQATDLNADHLVLAPTIIFHSAGERAVLGAMQAMAMWMVRLWKVPDRRARDSFGAGAFNMIRRDVYHAVGGFETLRLEILEDLFLGMRVKRAGFAQRIILGRNLARLRWIDGTFGIVGLVEKNGFAVTRFRTGLHLLARMAQTGRTLADLAALVQRLPQVLVNVPGVDKARAGGDPDLARAIAAAEADLGETGRVLLRPSGTEPLVRVMVEAADTEHARRVADQLAGVVKERLTL